jgi:hypothetical protein
MLWTEKGRELNEEKFSEGLEAYRNFGNDDVGGCATKFGDRDARCHEVVESAIIV